MELAGNEHGSTSEELEVFLASKLPLGEVSINNVHSYEKRFRKHFQQSLHIDQPIHENFSVIWKNVSLTRHISRIWLKACLSIAEPHLNLVDVLQVLSLDKESF